MKNSILFFTIIVFFASCDNDNNKKFSEVKLILKNKELTYLKSNLDSLTFENEYYNHYSIENIFKSNNNVVYEIQNNSQENLLFLMNPYRFNISSVNPIKKDGTNGRVEFVITDKKENKVGANVLDFNTNTYEEVKVLQKQSDLKLLQRQLRSKIGDKFVYDEIIQNSFILKPKQSAIFSVKLNLPLIEQPFIENDFSQVHILLSDQVYDFQLHYSLTWEDRDLLLSKEAIAKLENMNIKVFEGTLKSNIIKILPNQ